MGKKVIINADDLGMSEGFNEGAIKALRESSFVYYYHD